MDIKVRDLKQTDTIENSDKLMVLVDDELNLVKNITKEEFLTNVISKTENNALIQETDGNLYVNTSDIAASVTVLDNKFTNEIGDLDELTTTAKNNLVSAINEAAQSGGSSGCSGFNLFDLVIKDHVLSYEESKGYALQGTYVYKTPVAGSRYGYPTFIQKCFDEKTAGTATEVTLGDNTITMYINANGHQFYDIADKAAIDAWFDVYGVAWFYGTDTENERVFLPRKTLYNLSKEIPVIGNGLTLGLTDGSSNYGLFSSVVGSVPVNSTQSALYGSSVGTFSNTSSQAPAYLGLGVTTDVSKSGLVADLSNEVDKNSYLYIVVGNTEQESAITDVTEVTTSENDTIPLFTGMYFDFKPNNVSWLKAGEQANSGGIYTSCYNTLVNCLTETNNIYDLKVIETSNMEAGVDYSEYWKVNQTAMTFTTPTKISYLPINADTAAVMGNGITLGLTDGSSNYGLWPGSQGMTLVTDAYNKPIPSSSSNSSAPSTTARIGVTTDASKSGMVADLSSAKSTTAQLYFKVANAVENLELLDAGEVLEALSDKIGRSECKAYITETYQNGGSWYRVYSDGWIEQGKNQTNIEGIPVTITFMKTYTKAPFVSTVSSNTAQASAALSFVGVSAYDITNTDFKVKSNGNTVPWSWYACGY